MIKKIKSFSHDENMQIFNIEIIMLKDILKGFSTYLKGFST